MATENIGTASRQSGHDQPQTTIREGVALRSCRCGGLGMHASTAEAKRQQQALDPQCAPVRQGWRVRAHAQQATVRMAPLASRDTPSQQRGVSAAGVGVGPTPEPEREPEPDDELEAGSGTESVLYTGGIGMAWALRLTQLLGM